MPVTPQFPQKLKKLREEANLTQTQLADKILVSRGAISFYENGDRIPDIEVLARIANEFHVSTDWLLGLSETKSTDAQMRQVCDFTGLSEHAITNLHEIKSSPKIVNQAVINLIEGIFGSFLNRFQDYLWNCAMSSIPQERNLREWKIEWQKRRGKNPAHIRQIRLDDLDDIEDRNKQQELRDLIDTRKAHQEKILERALDYKNTDHWQIDISAHDYSEFYRSRVIKEVERLAEKVICTCKEQVFDAVANGDDSSSDKDE